MNTTKRTIVSLLACIFCTLTAFSQSYPLSEVDNERLAHAVNLIDQGQADSSRIILEDLVKKYPKSYLVNYEYTYTLCQIGEFKKANKILRKLENYPEANARLHAMIGNTYDYMGQPNKALKAYQNGLKKFPNTGVLYVEQGNVYLNQRKYDEAMSYYEKGIEVDPLYPTGYLRASMLYLSSTEPVWGMIYAEMFSLLKPEAGECAALNKRVVEILRNNIKKENDTLHVTLTKRNNIYMRKNAKPEEILNALESAYSSFEVAYESKVGIAAMMHGYKDTIDFDLFCKIRATVADSLVGSDDNLPLFNFQKKVIEAGFWKAYNIFIYRQAFPAEYEAFMADEENVNQLNTFMTWYNTASNFPNDKEHVSKNIFEREKKLSIRKKATNQ